LNVSFQSSDPRLHLQDGHDEASGSSSEVDDATETKVLVISSSDPAAACDNLIVSETEFYCLYEQIGAFNE
jgi:hypothetical protein